jgi:hypothetical protein
MYIQAVPVYGEQVCIKRLYMDADPTAARCQGVAVNHSYCTADDGYGKYPKHVE